MSQIGGCIFPSLLLWSLHILEVFLLCTVLLQEKKKSSPKRCMSEPMGKQKRWEALISSCLSPDCLGCSLVCILMFAFFFLLVFCVQVIVNSFCLASGAVPLVRSSPLLFWQAHAQVIGRLAVSVAALPFGAHSVCLSSRAIRKWLFTMWKIGLHLGERLAQKKVFALCRRLIIKRIVTLLVPRGILFGFSTKQWLFC